MAVEINSWADLDGIHSDRFSDYILMVDLDSNSAGYSTYASSSANSGNGWLPIGDSINGFFGSFNGNGFTISDLYINRPALNQVGLFGRFWVAEIWDLGMLNCDITGQNQVGAIVASPEGGSTMDDCWSTGTISGNDKIGGISGQLSIVTNNCYSEATVSGNNEVGGLFGNHNGTINNCFAIGNVSGNQYIGGLVGHGSTSAVYNDSYANGDVDSVLGWVGGLVGHTLISNITNCYSTGNVTSSGSNVGGLIGYHPSTVVTSSYYDSQTSGKSDTGYGEPKTTVEMQTQGTFTGWDFVIDWEISAGDYPRLIWEIEPVPEENIININVGDTFKDITAMKINIGDVWKDVVGVQINQGDVWKTIL